MRYLVELRFSTHITITVEDADSVDEALKKARSQIEAMWSPIRGLPSECLEELLDNANRLEEEDSVMEDV